MNNLPAISPSGPVVEFPPFRPVPARGNVPAWLLAMLLGVTTLTLYWPALRHDFINYDDPVYVTANPHVLAGLTLDGTRWAFTTGEGANWHPMTWLSLMLDVTFFGRGPAGMHFTNILLHAMDAILLFWLLRELTGATWRSLAVAALFAWHPAHVESVAWVAERKDVLSAFFGFLSLWFYVRYAREREVRSQKSEARIFYGGALICFACGLLSKPMLVTWPFVLLLVDFWPLGRVSPFQPSAFSPQPFRVWLPLIREKIPFFALAVAASVVTFLVQKHGGAVATMEVIPWSERLANAMVSYERYLEKLFWPENLAIFYPLQSHWPAGRLLLAGVVLAGISGLAWRRRRNCPGVLAGWLWYGGTLVPVIGLVQVGTQSMADRYTYIPSVGVLMMIVWGLAEWCRNSRAARAVIAGAGMVAGVWCLALTRHQLEFWQNDEALFQHDLAVAGNNFVAHYSLGVALNFHGHPDDAVTEFNEALVLEPDSAPAHYNLGNAFAKGGRVGPAMTQFQAAIRLQPDYPDAHNNLGNLLAGLGQTDAAISEFQDAIRLKPDVNDAHYNLGNAFLKTGRLGEAVDQFQQAIRLRPDYAPGYYNLGVALAKQGEAAAAISQLQDAIRLKPDYAIAHNSLGLTLAGQGRFDEAISEFQAAIRLKPDYASAQNNLARAQNLKRAPANP